MLAGCSGGDDAPVETGDDDDGELTPVKLQLQWLPQAQFAGYFAAIDQGFFEEEGLDGRDHPVRRRHRAAGRARQRRRRLRHRVGAEGARLDRGAAPNLTNIAQVFQRSGTLQVSWADSGIDSVADFEGKKIGSWGFGNEWEIFAAMAAEGLDSTTVEIITQDFNMNAFLQGDIDAAQAMTYNEYAQLLETTEPRHRRALPARGLQRHQLRG